VTEAKDTSSPDPLSLEALAREAYDAVVAAHPPGTVCPWDAMTGYSHASYVGVARWALERERARGFAAAARAFDSAASIIENVAHTCMTEEHCDALHAAHNTAAKKCREEASKLRATLAESPK
jgi:hypothetical protein